MNREDVIRLAKEAGVFVRGPYDDETGLTPQELERFANLVEAQQSDRYKALAGELAEAARLALAEAQSWIHDQLDGTGSLDGALRVLDPVRAALAKYEQEKGV